MLRWTGPRSLKRPRRSDTTRSSKPSNCKPEAGRCLALVVHAERNADLVQEGIKPVAAEDRIFDQLAIRRGARIVPGVCAQGIFVEQRIWRERHRRAGLGRLSLRADLRAGRGLSNLRELEIAYRSIVVEDRKRRLLLRSVQRRKIVRRRASAGYVAKIIVCTVGRKTECQVWAGPLRARQQTIKIRISRIDNRRYYYPSPSPRTGSCALFSRSNVRQRTLIALKVVG